MKIEEIYPIDMFDDLMKDDPFKPPKGPTENKYKPHQGAKEKARRLKKMKG